MSRQKRRARRRTRGALSPQLLRFVVVAKRYVRAHGWRAVQPESRVKGIDLHGSAANYRSRYHRGLLSRDFVEALESIPGWTWNLLLRRHQAMIDRVRRTMGRGGLLAIKANTPEGQWLSSARKRYRDGQLNPWLKSELEKLPGWTWERTREAALRRRAERMRPASLARFLRIADGIRRRIVVRNGVGFLPTGSRWKGLDLVKAVPRVRSMHAGGTLPAAVVNALESIPGWSWSPLVERSRRMIELIRRHVLDLGWDAVCGITVIDGERVGAWLNQQRKAYSRGRIRRWVQDQLEAIPGFSWTVPVATMRAQVRQRAALRQLVFLQRASRAFRGRRLKTNDRFQGRSLAPSIVFLERHHRAGTLDPAIALQLEALPGWTWNRSRSVMETSFSLLERLAARHGGLPDLTTSSIVGGRHIGAWLGRQWKAYRQGRLARELIERLESIPGWSWRRTIEEEHRRKLAALRRFLDQRDLADLHAHPQFEGIALRNWVYARRRAYRRGVAIPDWLIKELEKLPDWSWEPRRDRPMVQRRPQRRPVPGS